MVFSSGNPRKLKQPWFTQAILDAGVYIRVPKTRKERRRKGEKSGGDKKKKSTQSNTILKILKDEPLRKELYKISSIFLLIIK